jgi:tyrosine-protein phosphatase YwqE
MSALKVPFDAEFLKDGLEPTIAGLEEQNKELTREVERLRELIIEMCAAKVTTKNGR